ncbi:MAG: CpsB/CapC family capsule biosynthesis tyrosine phosphatase [Polyangiaceae bacterium]
MRGFVDLHCHFVAGIDDGARSPEESVELLRALRRAGFDRVIATPHMRPGLFDNTAGDLRAAYDALLPSLPTDGSLPTTELSSEHYFDDVVFSRLMNGEGLPYPGARAVLLEFYEINFPPMVDQRLADLRRNRALMPVIAHPERYHAIWQSPEILERLLDLGAAALLDVAALAGKYGRRAKACAETLLDAELYQAACSDAHRPADVESVLAGMQVIERRYGAEELDFLLRDGPLALLNGEIPT